MRAVPSALAAFILSGDPCFRADLFTIQLSGGGTVYLTSADQNVVYGGNTYLANLMAIDRTGWSLKNTTDVPAMTMQFYSTGEDYTEGENFMQLVHNGILDGAYITVSQAFMPTFGDTSLGVVLVFTGFSAPAQITSRGVMLTVKGDNVLMQQYFPRNVYQLGCIHNLGDSQCQVNLADFTTDNSVGGGGTVNQIFIPWGTVPGTPALYQLGIIKFTSGAALDQARGIQTANSSGLTLYYPLYDVPAPGDTFTVQYGCDKTTATCQNVFSNLQNRRGFEFIPPAETAY